MCQHSIGYQSYEMKIFFRKLHRWLGLLMALQIVAWMASGFYFSIFPIAEIRGEHLTRAAEVPALDEFARAPSPASVKQSLDQHFDGDWELSRATLVQMDEKVFWRIEGSFGNVPFNRLVGADGGGVKSRLGAEEAKRQAFGWLSVPAKDAVVEWLESEPEDLEFRGRQLPVWKVSFSEPESLNLYLDPWTGEILARRTDRWRLFDFLWMLHIMDFDTRDDFNHPLLQVAALLGLIVALSGFVFWSLTTRLFRRSRNPRMSA